MKKKNFAVIIIIMILLILFSSCANFPPWKTKFFVGKWITPVDNTYFVLEIRKDGTFETKGRKFCNIGTYTILNHEGNSAILKLKSISGLYDVTLLAYRYREGILVKYREYSKMWYSVNTEKAKIIIEKATRYTQNLYELETWYHYYLISFPSLGKTDKDLLQELGKPDNKQSLNNTEQIWFYDKKGEDDYGNIYSYNFFLLENRVTKVEYMTSIKSTGDIRD